jgi:hypothetical protein
MEFGFARFLEMFEERFGRAVTTAVLALVGMAVAAYSAKIIIEAVIYVYGLIKSAKFLVALSQESAASHIVIFAIQIVLTFVALGFIWRLFWRRKIKALRMTWRLGRLDASVGIHRLGMICPNHSIQVRLWGSSRSPGSGTSWSIVRIATGPSRSQMRRHQTRSLTPFDIG